MCLSYLCKFQKDLQWDRAQTHDAEVVEEGRWLIRDLRGSKYTDQEIMETMGVNEEEFQKFVDGQTVEVTLSNLKACLY